MDRLTQHPHFITHDAEELGAYISRLLDRRLGFVGQRQEVTASIHTATLELLTVSAVEITGGPATHTISKAYSLTRIEAGVMERRFACRDLHVLGPGQADLTMPGKQAVTRLRDGISTVTISLPAVLIDREAEYLIGEPATQPLEIIGPLNLGQYTYLGQSIDCLLDELERDDGLFVRFPLIGQRMQRALVRALIEHTQNNYTPLLARRHGGPARRHVAMMEEMVEANIRSPPTVSDLAHAIGVSVRTLYENCRHQRGLRPEDILRKMRLHAVHKRLENPQPQDTVTTIAHEYDVTNIKYFADAYQQEFHGERPTETLHRARKRLIIALGATLGNP